MEGLIQKAMDAVFWEVVHDANPLARAGVKLASAEVGRLTGGSILRQLALDGDRLHYELDSGSGPATGWVSVKVKGKQLLSKLGDALELPVPQEGEAPKKILMIPTALKGHIVHHRRIAEWFSERPGYEVHFLYYPQNVKDVPAKASNIVLHCVEDLAVDAYYLGMQSVFTDIAMEPKDKAVMGCTKAMMMELVEAARKNNDVLSELFKRIVQVLYEVKPDLIITEVNFQMYDLVPAYALTHKVPVIIVYCPGIPEPDMEAQKESMNEDMEAQVAAFGAEEIALLSGTTREAAERTVKGLPPAPDTRAPTTLFGLMSALEALPPEMGMMLSRPISEKLGMKALVWSKLRNVKDRLPKQIRVTIYPSSPAVVHAPEVGGIFVGPLLPLPEPVDGLVQQGREQFQAGAAGVDADLMQWLWAGEDDVPIIYIAFGTLVNPTRELYDRLAAALKDGPWRVLWALPKMSKGEEVPKSYDTDKWRIMPFVPQAQVLKCERVRCFISHCGMNSSTEALSSGVPMVCCPFYMDQYEWARTVCEYRKAGVTIDKHDTAPVVRQAVELVLNTPAYRENARICSKVMWDQSQDVLAKLGPELQSSGKLGVGTSVTAAIAMILLRGPLGEGTEEAPATRALQDLMKLTTAIRETAETASARSPVRELPS